MARKKVEKKLGKKKKVVKLTESDKISSEEDKQLKSEERQLLWFFVVVGTIFATVLVSYFATESLKSFEFGGADWMIEDYAEPQGTMYHGRFVNLIGEGFTYNIYLRNDPRKNDVPTEGTFDKFKYGTVISTSPEFDLCRGDASRVMRDLGAFMREGLGSGPLESGSTDRNVANDSKRRFASCDNIYDRTVLVIDVGDNFVAQNINNPNCYTISVEDCNDASSVEKFMIKTIEDFTLAKKTIKENSIST